MLYTDGHQTDLALPVVQKATARGVPVGDLLGELQRLQRGVEGGVVVK